MLWQVESVCSMNPKSMNKKTFLSLALAAALMGGFLADSIAKDYSILATSWTIKLNSAPAAESADIDQSAPDWSPLFAGIDFRKAESDDPLQKVCVLRIDTEQEGLRFYTNGRYQDFKDTERETERTTTVDFLSENELNVAVNANFYSPFNAETRVSRGPSNVIGLAVSDGVLVSTADSRYPSFTVSFGGVPEIRELGPEDSIEGIHTAVAGNRIVLREGKVVEQSDKAIHPRTAVGISRDRRYVYLMTIDGRQPTFSIGASYEDVGRWMLEFGAWEALNLDGGGSTSMVTREALGKAKVLNLPIGNGNIPGSLRHNANHLGVAIKKGK